MKYVLQINQLKMKETGLNLNQWLILDVLSTSSAWATPIVVDDEIYFWVSRQSIAREIEIINLKPDTIYRHLKKLSELGFIDYVKSGKKDCIRLTKIGKSLFTSTMSEIDNEHYVGSKQQNTMSEARPTYQYTSINKQAKFVCDFLDESQVKEIIKYRKSIKKTIHTQETFDSISKAIKKVMDAYQVSFDEVIGLLKEKGWTSITPEWVKDEFTHKQQKEETVWM